MVEFDHVALRDLEVGLHIHTDNHCDRFNQQLNM
jgi:hypothetical protein